MRIAKKKRKTKETEINLTLNIDGSGKYKVDTGIPFFDHMLALFAKHGLFDLQLRAQGDIKVDFHHTVEDVGIVLGEAFREALGDKKGIKRYGFFILPMDESLATVAVDFSERPYLKLDAKLGRGKIGDFHTELLPEFFQAFTNSARINLHLSLNDGGNKHHQAEALFKGLAKALDMATQIDTRIKGIPSTKGVL